MYFTYDDLPRPTIFAHRGASFYAPENTLASFKLAVEQNAPSLELDAKLSADGVVVVIHDQTVDRTTAGSGRVSEMPLSALKELDAGFKFDPKYKGEPIPTLEEVFETVGKDIFINIELTNYSTLFDDELPEKVTRVVKKHDLVQHVMFSSFNPFALRRAHRILPEVPLGLLAFPGRNGAWARSFPGRLIVPYQALHPERQNVTEKMIARLHLRGQRIHVYTVNEPQVMQRLFAWSVDGIFTDDTPLAQKVLQAYKSQTL